MNRSRPRYRQIPLEQLPVIQQLLGQLRDGGHAEVCQALDVGARNGAKPTDHAQDKGAVTIDDSRSDFHNAIPNSL
jgi:hypothetical protein